MERPLFQGRAAGRRDQRRARRLHPLARGPRLHGGHAGRKLFEVRDRDARSTIRVLQGQQGPVGRCTHQHALSQRRDRHGGHGPSGRAVRGFRGRRPASHRKWSGNLVRAAGERLVEDELFVRPRGTDRDLARMDGPAHELCARLLPALLHGMAGGTGQGRPYRPAGGRPGLPGELGRLMPAPSGSVPGKGGSSIR